MLHWIGKTADRLCVLPQPIVSFLFMHLLYIAVKVPFHELSTVRETPSSLFLPNLRYFALRLAANTMAPFDECDYFFPMLSARIR